MISSDDDDGKLNANWACAARLIYVTRREGWDLTESSSLLVQVTKPAQLSLIPRLLIYRVESFFGDQNNLHIGCGCDSLNP